MAGIFRNKPLHLLFQIPEVTAGHLAGDEGGKCADILRDGHLVVVEDDDQVLFEMPGLVEGFEGHAAGQGAVADNGNGLIFRARQISRGRHAQARPRWRWRSGRRRRHRASDSLRLGKPVIPLYWRWV